VTLRVVLVQHASGLEPEDNRRLLAELTPDDADLVVFPEAFARDFGSPGSDVSGHAEPGDGPFGQELERLAGKWSTTMLAGMFEVSDDPDRPYNTLLLRGAVRADYRKVHLYDSFGYKESDRLSAGPITAVTAPLGEFTLGLMTCYDLRFPEQARALVDAGADVLVAPSAWVAGDRKVDHWRTLVRARAIENVAYVVAAAQPGPRYSGHSMVVDPYGEVVVEAGFEPVTLRAELDPAVVEEARRTNPSLANRRR
jgi:predicted amidohydrolase